MAARGMALAGTLCTVIGAVLLTASVAATRRLWFGGFVSEAGIGDAAGPYRVGLWCAAAGMALLGLTLAREAWVAAGLLTGAGAGSALSAVLPCSAGCPLPPYEPTTAGDLVHAAVSILAVAAIALAMLAVAGFGPDPLRRTVSRIAASVVVPLVAAVGVALLALGKGHVTGVLERLVLIGVTGWILAMCLTLARRPALGHSDNLCKHRQDDGRSVRHQGGSGPRRGV